jgi:hypothetical protein
MSFSRSDIAFQGVFSSSTHALSDANGIITTNATPLVIPVKDADGNAQTAGSIALECVTACEISFGSTAYHKFKAGEKLVFDRVAFTALTVKTAASQLRFYGCYT